jgi:hypothetical protein
VGVLLPRVLTIAVTGLAVVGLVAALAMVGERLWRVLRGHTAIATVVDVKIEHGEEQHLLYVPVVDFVTRDGQRLTGVALKDALGRNPRIGRRVRIIYRPRNPAWATMPMWFQTFAVLLGAILIAAFATGCIAGVFFGRDWFS